MGCSAVVLGGVSLLEPWMVQRGQPILVLKRGGLSQLPIVVSLRREDRVKHQSWSFIEERDKDGGWWAVWRVLQYRMCCGRAHLRMP